MEGKKSKSRALLVFGAPCSGKTTFCTKFSEQFKLPFINLDDLKDQYDLTHDQLLMLVEQLTKTRQTLIFEGGIDTEAERNELRSLLTRANYEPVLIWIQTDISTLKVRLKSRLKSAAKAKNAYDERVQCLEAPSGTENPIVLSGKHTFSTQLKHVLTRLI